MNWITALREAFTNGSAQGLTLDDTPNTGSWEYAAWRLLRAWQDSPELGPDHAVLLRQLARWQPGLHLGDLPPDLAIWAPHVGVQQQAGKLFADPFAPRWLDGQGVVDGLPAFRRRKENFPAEPYLSLLKTKEWLSWPQKEAAWLLLRAPCPSTCLVALPTGAGKSLCFQLLARASSRLNVVIVPTVALAVDQYQSAIKRLADVPDLNPRYFAADDGSIDPEQVVEEVCAGKCRLVFTSPEACVHGRLRDALDEVVKTGRLENLILDEAHLIETWGIYFRVDFQLLSQLRMQWLQQQPFRTVLLSATFTPNTVQVLQNLYGAGGSWHQLIAQRLRPEMDYYVASFRCKEWDWPQERRQAVENHDRDAAVHECLWRLPRPAIFYTTEVDEAQLLYQEVSQQGFGRVGLFTGDTSGRERRELLKRWKDDQIDLMVATSAFGLGVDKLDVRSVVHVCLPENLHRYYQEVGRSGRDGYSACCILLPTSHDVAVAKGLAPKLMDTEILQARWEAMWRAAKVVAGPVDALQFYKIPVNAVHNGLLAGRTGQQNIDWNRRLVMQFVRANKLELRGIEYERVDDDHDPVEWVVCRPLFQPNAADAAAEIKDTREKELQAVQAGFDQMLRYVDGDRCVNALLRQVYNIPDDGGTCGRCPVCRRRGRQPSPCGAMFLHLPNDSAPPDLIEVMNCPPVTDPSNLPWRNCLRRIVKDKGISRFACLRSHFDKLLAMFEPAFNEDIQPPYRVDWISGCNHPLLSDSEAMAIFHFGDPDPELLRYRHGRQLVHLYPAKARVILPSGHRPLESDGATFYANIESWLRGN